MQWSAGVWLRLKALLKRRSFDHDLDDELAFHLAMREEKHASAGVPGSETPFLTRREFGNAARIKEACREMRTFTSLESFWQDMRYGMRALRRAPGFALVAIVTLAIGIGVSTWVFNLLRQWVIQAAAFPQGDRLMVLWETDTKRGSEFPASAPDFLDWREQNREFESLSAWVSQEFNLAGLDMPQRVLGARVSTDFFRTLKIRPVHGRDFRSEEDEPGLGHVALISTGMWHERFNSDPDTLGKTFLMDGEPYTLIGVVPDDFHLTLMGRANVLVPLAFTAKERMDRSTAWLNVIGRLKPGVREAVAQQSLSAIASQLEKQYPASNINQGILCNSLTKEIGKHTGDQAIYTSFVVGICILLISCSNIAGIYLSRFLLRRKEMTMRLALGAQRRRLARQLLAENILLLPLAVGLGLGLAFVGGGWITSAIPYENRGYLPNYGRLYMDSATFLYATGISLVSLLVFSFAPMLEGWRIDLNNVLRETIGSPSFSSRRLRRALVVTEIVLALVVLVPAGLTTRSLIRRFQENPGFDADVLTARVSLPVAKYKNALQWRNFYDRLLDRVQTLPHVKSAALGQFIPFGVDYAGREFVIEGRPEPKAGETPGTLLNSVTPGYAATLGLHLIRGRWIGNQDGPDTLPVVVVNERLAQRWFLSADPLGHRLRLGRDDTTWRTIVGVVNDVKTSDLGDPPQSQSYIPFAQSPSPSATLVISTHAGSPTRPVLPLWEASAAPLSLATALREAAGEVDKAQPISDIESIAQRIRDQEAPYRIFTALSGIFALMALFLAAIGIYGVMAFLVESRTREIGIRMACGARPRTILWLVLGSNLKLIVAGISIGLVLSWAVARLLASILYRVTSNDPATYGIAVVVLSVAILLASIVPLRRASRVDPMKVLRYE